MLGVLEGVEYDWFDTMTRGRLVGSSPLAWGEFSQLFMAHFLPESVRDGLAHEFERLVQTKGMPVSEYIARFTQLSRHAPYPITEEMRVKSNKRRKEAVAKILAKKKQRVEGSQSSHPSVGVGSVLGYQCGQESHIRMDCQVAVTQPSSSHASAPAALASSQAPSAPVRQFGGSSGRGSGMAK
ncbi:Retrotransposon gag domain [Sesbania bispinosa]|nr:Retrotransposon gag domain [Sesbania bispinosa]